MSRIADVCLILEGTYPYVAGGVSSWTHELIQRQNHLNFHLVTILPKEGEFEMKFKLPSNVTGHTIIRLQDLPSRMGAARPLDAMEGALNNITVGAASLKDLEHVMRVLKTFRGKPGEEELLNSEHAWNLMVDMYETSFRDNSFLDYFWSWRAMIGSLYSILLADIPEAKIYHALSTGYAGLFAARARLETDRPVFVTEHGIYTNERRIEVAQASWLEEKFSRALTIDNVNRSLRDFWIETFTNYSRICYEASIKVVTLFEGNQQAQLADGAKADKMQVIPNGVDVARFEAIQRNSSKPRPTIALVGRVVPIKDVKSFIRSCAMLREHIPDLKAYIIGSAEEDETYEQECREMVDYLALGSTVEFTGQVRVDEYFGDIDVLVLSSISEAQPLVILEAFAAGIPVVATNVGACPEMILGREDEEPHFGAAGAVVPLSNPLAIAEAVYTLLTNRDTYEAASEAARKRVSTYYTKEQQYVAYKALYATMM